MPDIPSNDPHAILMTCIKHQIFTQKQWREMRDKHPDMIPASNAVVRVWGSFSNLFDAVRKHDYNMAFMYYYDLSMKLGRPASAWDCKQAGIDVSILYQNGDRQTAKDLVVEIMRIRNAKKKRTEPNLQKTCDTQQGIPQQVSQEQAIVQGHVDSI